MTLYYTHYLKPRFQEFYVTAKGMYKESSSYSRSLWIPNQDSTCLYRIKEGRIYRFNFLKGWWVEVRYSIDYLIFGFENYPRKLEFYRREINKINWEETYTKGMYVKELRGYYKI